LCYQGRKAAKDAAAVERMRELSAQYPRYGYRRIRIFLGRDGHRMSVGRAYRLWRAAGLQLPRKRPRKRVAAARPRPQSTRPVKATGESGCGRGGGSIKQLRRRDFVGANSKVAAR
jgi:transposase InsO family protein